MVEILEMNLMNKVDGCKQEKMCCLQLTALSKAEEGEKSIFMSERNASELLACNEEMYFGTYAISEHCKDKCL